MAFKNLKDLEKYLNKQIAMAMEKEVSENVRDTMQRKIQEVVYDAYDNPKTPRRYDNDGLMDRRNMEGTIIPSTDGVTLEVRNVADGNPNVDYTDLTWGNNSLANIIENGRLPERNGLYTTNSDGTQDDYLKARPFMKETEMEIQRTNSHVDSLKKGLKNRGLEVE